MRLVVKLVRDKFFIRMNMTIWYKFVHLAIDSGRSLDKILSIYVLQNLTNSDHHLQHSSNLVSSSPVDFFLGAWAITPWVSDPAGDSSDLQL